MGRSPSRRFGQIIGEVLEAAIIPLLSGFAKKHGLYLDMKGARPCRKGLKCSWIDLNKNSHDLDFVLERGGTPHEKGMPAAFIETAWRRYTKHSRNKAQEIQGSILPLAETYRNAGPFIGAILAGVFTDGALKQLKSLGFTVLYFPYETVIEVFKKYGLDAAFDENTPDREFQEKVEAYERLSSAKRAKLTKRLLEANAAGAQQFVDSLTEAVSRQIEMIVILPLYGTPHKSATVDEAIRYVREYHESEGSKIIDRYEIQVRYNNGNLIEGKFKDKDSAIEFLRVYQPVFIEQP